MNIPVGQFYFRSRLQHKFVLLFIVLATTPLLLLGSLALYLIDISHRHDVSALELQLIDQKSEEIKKFISDAEGVLEFHLSGEGDKHVPLFEVSMSNTELAFLRAGPLKSNRAFEEIILLNAQGEEILRRNRWENRGEVKNIYATDLFKRVFEEQKSVISDVHYTLGGPSFTILVPVRNPNGDIVRYVLAEVNLSSLVRSVENARLGAAGYLVLLDSNGTLIGRGSKTQERGADFSWFDRFQSVSAGGIVDGLSDADRHRRVFSGYPVVSAGKKIAGTNWALLAEWPIEDADAIIYDIRKQVLQLTLASIFTVILLAILFAARLVKPIRELIQGASKIERGNFDTTVDIQTADELRDLGSAFNSMTKGLKRLQELKSEFVFIAAHELRTPVTAIKGYLSLILEGSAGAVSTQMKEFLDIIWQSNERLIRLVNDILEIARSEAGRLATAVEPVDIRKSIWAILTEIKPIADEKKIVLTYDPPQNTPLVLGDAMRIKEVAMNFVSNAIKYNNEGGIVKLSHEIRDDDVVTHVEDNGFGMSEEDKKHIFEKFFRSESKQTKAVQGTGLGLFITKELVEKMGGAVWFVSEAGRGTTFSFSLKRSDRPPAKS